MYSEADHPPPLGCQPRNFLSGENCYTRTKYNTDNQTLCPFGKRGDLSIYSLLGEMQSSRSAFHHDRYLFLHLKQSIAVCDCLMWLGPPRAARSVREGTRCARLAAGLTTGPRTARTGKDEQGSTARQSQGKPLPTFTGVMEMRPLSSSLGSGPFRLKNILQKSSVLQYVSNH